MSAHTIVKNTLLQANPSLHYVSASAKALRLESEFEADHHVCAFVLVPVPQEGPPTIVIGAVAPEREDALRAMALDVVQPTFASFQHVAQANGAAIVAFQQDVANSSMAKDMFAKAKAFQDKVQALAASGDPVLKFILEEIGCYFGDLLYMCGETEFDPTNFAAMVQFVSGYVRSAPDSWTNYLQESASTQVEGFRAELGNPPSTDPGNVN